MQSTEINRQTSLKTGQIDVCVVDFDGCMIPGISKVIVARDVALMIALRPLQQKDRIYLPRMAAAAAFLFAARAWQKSSGRLTDGDLVRLYVRFMDPIPDRYFLHAAEKIPRRFLPGVERAFQWLADRWPVGVISLALLPVLEAADLYLSQAAEASFAFKCGNELSFSQTQQILSADDKRTRMEKELNMLNCSCPLVIGHDQDDLEMAALAREMGGFSVGLAPPAAIADQFDIVIPSRNWHLIPAALERLS